MHLAILLNHTPLHHWGLWFSKMHLAILLSCSIKHPERPVFDLLTLCGLPVSRRCRRQAAKCLRPASTPVLLGGAGAYTATPGSSHLLCDWEYKAGGWENTKGCELQGKVLHARIRWMRKKRETWKESADGLDPEKYLCNGFGRHWKW